MKIIFFLASQVKWRTGEGKGHYRHSSPTSSIFAYKTFVSSPGPAEYKTLNKFENMSLSRDIQVIFDDFEKEKDTFFEDDDFFKAHSMFKSSNSLFNNTNSLINKETSQFNSNARERDSTEFGKFPETFRARLPANESFGELVPMSFPAIPSTFSANEFSWNADKTEWGKEIQLNSQHSYSNINVNVKNNVLMIGAAEEKINEQVNELNLLSLII